MRYWLLITGLLMGRMAAAQTVPVPVPMPLPATNLQSTVNTTTLKDTPGVRYQYQAVYPDTYCVWLAPAWRGQTKLEPKRYMFNTNYRGELEGMLMQTINELSADGWEFVEIRTESRTTGATQTIEKEAQSIGANNPVYKATTSFHTSSETRYLFRKALVN
ncbi:hypothetical protein [Hymenobacter arizonensis]|uniref:DUF4177 domain-containing protein n=1 Tax=Hymenobacter arizonensis TaxID=1227077 RepID=A0A1I5WSS0_HYMAR|nr:hypothetical protein [Hymenobacter arizonensis]SFQ22803.1 hypothetical protein SAMN04515668_1473 [Hymenobacter arizonensis]